MERVIPLSQSQRAERRWSLSRRRFLRGLGVLAAVPAFESLSAIPLRAAELGSTPGGTPLRMAFVYFPNGALPSHWWPKQEGAEGAEGAEGSGLELNTTMAPLDPVKHQTQVISGLDHINATPGNDGPGDHARASATYLTGVRARKTAGSDIHVGVSIDQVAARHIGHLTRFPSLELSCDAVRKSGSCDSGYSCAYQYNLSWWSPTTPVAPEPNPRLVFERLFGAGPRSVRQKNYALRQQTQRSVLDFVLEDARELQHDLNPNDQRKLDEYLTSVREIEQRLSHAEKLGDVPDLAADTPEGIPGVFEQHIQIMFDLMALAFQTDSTRIATFLLANEGSNRAFPELGFPEGHHYLTHHNGRVEMMEKVAQIDLFYMKFFAQFLQKLEQLKDPNGQSILHNSMIVYGCGNSDGNRHTHTNLPIILAGGAGGTLRTGRYLKVQSAPMTNMFLGMVDRLGIKGIDQFGDSTERLDAI